MFYNTLQNKSSFTKSTPLHRWESDLGQSYTVDKWEKACKSTYKATCCSTLWELAVKLTNRWYLTPDKTANYTRNLDNSCWKQCGQKGDILHIFWNCPKLTNYWNSLFRLLSDITQITIPMRPSLALLSLDIDQYPIPIRNVMIHFLLSARLNVTRKWRDPEPPTIREVVQTTHVHFSHETTLALRHKNQTQYLKLWQPWIRLTKSLGIVEVLGSQH